MSYVDLHLLESIDYLLYVTVLSSISKIFVFMIKL